MAISAIPRGSLKADDLNKELSTEFDPRMRDLIQKIFVRSDIETVIMKKNRVTDLAQQVQLERRRHGLGR